MVNTWKLESVFKVKKIKIGVIRNSMTYFATNFEKKKV